MVPKIMAAQLDKDPNSAPGVLECFTDSEILTYAESFWGKEFKNLIESRVIPSRHFQLTCCEFSLPISNVPSFESRTTVGYISP